MVIGHGMLANAFKKYHDIDHILIFASGVSNSKEDNESEFKREFNLLKNSILQNPNKVFVYFSSCSIFDSTLLDTKYVNHKISIEEYIMKNAKKFIIFRLPLVVGITNNKNTLFSFFKNSLINNTTLNIQNNAYRYLIDIEDVYFFISNIIDNYLEEFKNIILNICLDNKIQVKSLALKMKKKIKSNSKIAIQEGGSSYDIDNSKFLEFLKKNNIFVNRNYVDQLIKKYLNDKK